MGNGFAVYPLKEALNSPTIRRQLDDAGLEYPAPISEGRYPTFAELLDVAQSIPGYRVEWSGMEKNWQMRIKEDIPVVNGVYAGRWVTLEAEDYGDQLAHPHGFWVYRGWPQAIVLVMSYIARNYGPFVVMHELGEDLSWSPPQRCRKPNG